MAKDIIITPASGTIEFKDGATRLGRIYESNGNVFFETTNDLVIGDGSPADVEFGALNVPVSLTLLGGGSFTGGGNTIDIGSAGDTINLNVAGVTYNMPTHSHLISDIVNLQTTLSSFVTGSYVSTQISTAIANLIDSAPGTLDTLNELAAALGDDPNFATTITNALAGKLSTSGKAADSNLLDGIDSTGFMRAANANGYYGLARPSDGDTSDWIRTTANGLIPYTSGGYSSLGTSSWPFNTIYGSIIYENNTALSSKYLGISATASNSNQLLGSSWTSTDKTVRWSGGSGYHGNPRSMAIGYSGGNYGQFGYGLDFTGTSGVHTYAIADVATRVDMYGGLVVYGAPSGTVGTNINWTETFRARYNESAPTFKGNTIWHSGNDGSGSGLDADTLDGVNSASFLRSDTADSWSAKLTYTGSSEGLEVAGIRGNTLGSQTGDYIHLYERVHIGYPSGWGASAATAPSYGLGVWGGINLGMDGSGVLQINGTTIVTAARQLTNVTNTNWDAAYSWGNHAGLYAAASHNHDSIYVKYGSTRLTGDASQILTTSINPWDVSTASDAPSGTTDGILTTGMWDWNGWGTQLYHDFHSNTIYIRSRQNSAWQTSWATVYTTDNFNPSNYLTTSGKAADSNLLDGIDSASFLRSDANDTFTGALTIIGDIRGNGQQLVLNAGESYAYATSQTDEYVYVNAEQGLMVTTTPDNWSSLWAGRQTTIITGSSISVGGNTVWHTGNDGAGSGLDADTLDGQQASAFAAASHTHSQYATLASPALTGTPTAPTATAGTNTTQIATTAFVSTAITNLIGGAPGTLDTLNELAAAINDDANYASTLTTALSTKLGNSGAQQLEKTAHAPGTSSYHMEFYSPDTGDSNNEISLRFHQGNRYWGQLRYRNGAFRITGGADDNVGSLYANIVGNVTGNVTGSAGSVAWGNITGTPSTFTPSAHNQAWSTITSTPTTLAGYGITDAASSSHTHTFASLTSKPTTLSGYGITDAATSAQGAKADTALQSIAANSIGASQLNVSGNGTTAQYLRSDGDGSFSWVTPPDTNTTYSAGTGLTLSGTTFSVTAGTYAAASHTHDDRYYTETESDNRYMRADTDANTAGAIRINGSYSYGTYTAASNYKTGADNLVLKGNANGVSGIFFESEKDGTNINHPSDFGFIQYSAYGTGTSGESNELVIGVSNDADDHLVLNAPDVNGLKFRTGASTTDNTVYHSGNLTLATLGYTGATNANYITNNNQLANGAGYITSSGSISGNAATATLASTVTINYNNNSNSTYQMLWGSGTSVYGTGSVYLNPSTNYVYASSFNAGDWFRSSGSTGWYNQSYGGGIYMQDGTWVRVYNNKQFLAENIIQSNTAIYAPIFYDTNNTNYFVDPASTSNLNTLYTNTLYVNGIDYINYSNGIHSGSDFVDGTLVKTTIDASGTNGASFIMEVTGKSYVTSHSPFSLILQGYIYNNTFIATSAISNGTSFPSPIQILEYNGELCFWWPRWGYWNSFNVKVRDANGNNRNQAYYIGNSTEPASSKKVAVTPFQSWTTYNFSQSSVNNWNSAYSWGNHSTAGYAPLASPALTGTPTAPTASAATNNTQIATTQYVTTAINNLIGGAPTALDTLNELAAAINDDASYASTLSTALSGKVAKTGDTMTGSLSLSADNKVIFGPNSGWGKYLSIGGNANNSDASTASIGTTNGNLHIDAAAGSFATYLNYYDGTAGVAFGSGAGGIVAFMGPDGDLWKGSSDNTGNKYWHAGDFANNSTNWNTAYNERNRWDGGSTGLNAATGRASLGLGTAATSNTGDFAAASHSHTFASLTSKPTTISGYGITDAITTGNIGSQSVSYSAASGTAGTSLSTSRGIIEDTRSAQRTPNDYDDYRVSFEFTNQMPHDSNWLSIMTMQGWSNGYNAWQIQGPATSSDQNSWYLRSGRNTTWGTANLIIHSGNISSQSVNYANSAGSATNADTVDSLHASSFLRSDTTNSVYRVTAGDGNRIQFWDSTNYAIWMSSTGNSTWGGRLDTTSDYNMYFRMASGTNRGFVFKNSTTDVAQIAGDGTIYTASHGNSSNWKSAYDWGNHANAGYLTSVPAQSFASLTGKPTTLSGYGITDAASSSHTHTFASLTSKPTTLSGYGITDAATSSHNHDSAYAKIQNSAYYVEAGGTTGNFTASVPEVTALYDGLTLMMYAAQAFASYNYMDLNGFGAKQIYLYNTSRLTTHYPQYSVIRLVYNSTKNGGCWFTDMYYDSTDDYRIRWQNNITFGAYTHGYQILLEGADGKFYPVTEGGSTGNTNTVSTAELKLGGTILYYSSATDRAANYEGGGYDLYSGIYNGEMEYWNNVDAGWAVPYRSFYFVGTVNANGNFVLDNTTYTSFLTQDLPTTEDGKVYVQVGIMNNNYDAYRLNVDHPIYEFKNGKVRNYIPEHTHTIAEVTGLQTALDGKQAAGSYASSSHTHTFASLTSKPTTLSGYGITDAATSTHNHDTAYLGISATAADSNKLGGIAASSYSQTSHNHTYNVNDAWLRDNGDNAHVKLYGNSRQMVFRTDGTTEYASGVGGYPFAWMYGGDAASNRRMLLNNSGQLWLSNYGWLHDYFQAAGSAINTSNIGSQSVNIANKIQSSINWGGAVTFNNFREVGKTRVYDVLGYDYGSSTNMPGGFNYGTLLSVSGDYSHFEMYMPNNTGNFIHPQYVPYFRTGYNGGWSDWSRLVTSAGDITTLVGGDGVSLVVDSQVGWGQPASAILELNAQSDNWASSSFRFMAKAPDNMGTQLLIDKYTVNGGWVNLGYVDKNADNNLYWMTDVIQGFSDNRLKTNVNTLTGALETVSQLRAVTFDWDPEMQEYHRKEGSDLGFIAQEIEEFLPEVVVTRPDGYKTVKYEKVVPVLVEAIKEQQATINALIARIEALENK